MKHMSGEGNSIYDSGTTEVLSHMPIYKPAETGLHPEYESSPGGQGRVQGSYMSL